MKSDYNIRIKEGSDLVASKSAVKKIKRRKQPEIQQTPRIAQVAATVMVLLALATAVVYFVVKDSNSTGPGSATNGTQDVQSKINDLQNKLQQNPNDLQAQLSLAHLFLDSKQNDKAEELYNKALQANSQNAEAISHLGNIEEARQNVTAAIEKYNQALKIQPDYVHALWDKGLLLKSLGRKNDSILVFEQFLKIMPSGADADRVKGWINEMKNQRGLAKP